MDCSICMSLCVFPVQLKCKHIFCYLCVKGVVHQNNKCPLCRQRINRNILNRPKFVRRSVNSDRPSVAFDSNQWFYEGKSGTGWWGYDNNSSQLLENAFNSGLKLCQITVCGIAYIVDFDESVQYRRDQPKRKRKVKRELLCNINIAKGVAGVSKNWVKDVFGRLPSNETTNSASAQQNSTICNSTSVVTNVEHKNQNQIEIKTEIKTEIKVEKETDY